MKIFLVLTGLCLSLQLPAQQQSDNDSATFYMSKGEYDRALPFAKRSFETAKKNNLSDSIYITAACRLADLYGNLVKFDSAMVYYVKAAEWAKMKYGDSSAEYGYHLVTVAGIYRNLGEYRQAEERFKNVTSILQKLDNPGYTGDISYLKTFKNSYLIYYSTFLMTTGRLNLAEELSLQACRIALTEPVDMSVYTVALDNLSTLYGKMGFYAKQDTALIRVYDIKKKIFGENHPLFAVALGGLAAVYQRNKKFDKADSLFQRALEIRRHSLDKNSATIIPLLNRLGVVNIEMGKYRIAENYLEEAAGIIHANGGEKFALYPYCMKNLALLYVLTGRKELAEPLFKKCLTIYNTAGLELHSDRLKLLHDMAEYLYADDPFDASIFLKEAMSAEKKLLLDKLDFLSEEELLAYTKVGKDAAESPFRFLLHFKSPAMAGAAYDSHLLMTGIGLENSRALYQKMAQSTDVELSLLWKNYLQRKIFYTNLLLIPIGERLFNTDSLATSLNQQEKDILRRSVDYRNMKQKLAITWQDVQKHLLPNQAAIEFVKFTAKEKPNVNGNSDRVYYGALLLRPLDTVPRFILLCDENQLTNAIKKFPYKAIVNSRGEQSGGTSQNAANDLYQMLWQPLQLYLMHTSTVYFSLTGSLHRVSFAAIADKKDELLCEKFDLVQVTSTRQIALQEKRPPAPVSIALFGGINYNARTTDTSGITHPHLYHGHCGAEGDSFLFLPNTLKEIKAIKTNADALRQRCIVFKAGHATEAAFKALGGDNSPETIHFATHGFALAEASTQGKEKGGTPFRTSENPLLRCGLVMAGGNIGWKGRAGLNEDDGILTGLEISAVQLPNTQLAVLSACETGLGEIEGSEGVFGMQRAFKLAGVNYIMASLWQVPDKETAEFMKIFYTHFLAGKAIRAAFFATQQTMRKKYEPYYWAGFTLVQ
jgi:CHAT domain-containing protein/tetratricopeptide (TPR) repeat protein